MTNKNEANIVVNGGGDWCYLISVSWRWWRRQIVLRAKGRWFVIIVIIFSLRSRINYTVIVFSIAINVWFGTFSKSTTNPTSYRRRIHFRHAKNASIRNDRKWLWKGSQNEFVLDYGIDCSFILNTGGWWRSNLLLRGTQVRFTYLNDLLMWFSVSR